MKYRVKKLGYECNYPFILEMRIFLMWYSVDSFPDLISAKLEIKRIKEVSLDTIVHKE